VKIQVVCRWKKNGWEGGRSKGKDKEEEEERDKIVYRPELR
jgi:hypothetical protein